MALTANTAFNEFYSKINLENSLREKANNRRDHIVSLLKKKYTIIDSFNSGSIHRFTALKTTSDLDIFVVLHYGMHIENHTPIQVLQNIRDCLSESKTSVRKNGQAVTLYYKYWPNVDIVPACQDVDERYYLIPDMNNGSWIKTNPKTHNDDINSRSAICGTPFRQLIKFIKQWNKANYSILQSYHIEVMALKIFSDVIVDIPWSIFVFFDTAVTIIMSPLYHNVGFVDSYLDDSKRKHALTLLERARDDARSAWWNYDCNKNDEKAIHFWRKIFGDKFPPYG